jgi:hypothetical protein
MPPRKRRSKTAPPPRRSQAPQAQGKRRKKRAAGGPSIGGSQGSASFNEIVQHFVNPFSEGPGQKLYDRFTGRSVAYRTRTFNTLTSQAGGVFAVQFLGKVGSGSYLNPTYTAGGIFPTTGRGAATGPADQASILANFDKYRITSWGVRVYNTTAPLSSSGFLTFATHAYGDSAILNAYNPATDVPLQRTEVPLTPGCVFEWWGRPLDNQAEEFQAISGTAFENNWTALVLSYTGAAATTVRLEVVYNLELLPKAGTFTEKLATPANPEWPAVEQAVANIRAGSRFVVNAARIASAAGQAAAQLSTLYYGAPRSSLTQRSVPAIEWR